MINKIKNWKYEIFVFLKHYFLEVNGFILFISLSSVITVFCFKVNDLVWQGILLSIIAASIFYYFDSYLPLLEKRKKEVESFEKPIEKILVDCREISLDFNLKREELPIRNIEEFYRDLKKRFLSKEKIQNLIEQAYQEKPQVKYADDFIIEKSIIETRNYHIFQTMLKIESHIQKIMPTISSPELKEKLALLVTSEYFDRINYLVGVSIEHNNPLLQHRLLDKIPVEIILEFNQIVLDIGEYLLKNSKLYRKRFAEELKHFKEK